MKHFRILIFLLLNCALNCRLSFGQNDMLSIKGKWKFLQMKKDNMVMSVDDTAGMFKSFETEYLKAFSKKSLSLSDSLLLSTQVNNSLREMRKFFIEFKDKNVFSYCLGACKDGKYRLNAGEKEIVFVENSEEESVSTYLFTGNDRRRMMLLSDGVQLVLQKE